MKAPRLSTVDRFATLAPLLLACGAMVGACSIRPPSGAAVPPPSEGCALRLESMAPRAVSTEAAGGLALRIKEALRPSEGGAPEMLVLSGGSENGAFGAGFLSEWARARGGRLPDFRVVTGVSTGALQATAAFVGDPSSLIEGGYEIDGEGDLLTPYSGVTGGRRPSKLRIATALVRHGALANLDPLRARVRRILFSPRADGGGTLLDAAARKARTGALLLVGVVDMDSGQAVAIDAGDLAVRWSEAEGMRRAKLAECYVEAVIASSSAPMAAPPVFIDGRMYADGGLRFGLFADEVADAVVKPAIDDVSGKPLIALAPRRDWRPSTYLIVNTHLDYTPRCPELTAGDPARPEGEQPGGEPCWSPDRVHADWRFDQVALESERIFANQVYRLSKERLVERLAAKATQIPTAREMRERPDLFAWQGRSCASWRALDERESRPVQFHPRYMRCMIAVGRAEYRRSGW